MASAAARVEPRTDAILARLASLHPRLIDLSLDRVCELLSRLGDPHLALPPVIHVAGTNGKGSLIAYLRAIFEAAALRVHAYTSPHLVRFNERIRLAGRLIDDPALESLLEEVERRNEGRAITQFEITTAAAFLAFARTPADVLLLETGLGGEFDATNVIAKPLLSAITPIDYDHMEFLGTSLRSIAVAKAGIIKPDVPVIVAPQHAEALAVIEARAAYLRAPLHRAGREWRIERDAAGFRFITAGRELSLPSPALPGAHQFDNAANAVAAILAQGAFAVPDAAIASGLQRAQWPARLQRLRRGPLLTKLMRTELWLDGGHNPHCAQAIRDWALALEPAGRLDIVVAMKSNKDLRAFLNELAPVADRIVGIAIPDDPASHRPDDIVAAARGLGCQALAAPDIDAAIAELADKPAKRILICGSLYLAGAILREHA